ncbi:hypothetical protein L3X38_024999 [Prunus dulcis]|uniref:Uncharacterized protein n=1 Tax=Prunus dulcis TaxID=3755 RepID=A0AAD4Z6Y0_PRUDU|nr:hypothetical protein L3X38_024999 [Prunus dulcis]
MIKTVLFPKETPISLKEFRAHLLSAERNIESQLQAMSHSMTGFVGSTTYVYGSSSQTSSSSNVVPSPTVGHISAQPHTTFVLGFAGFKTPPLAPNYGSSSFIQS